MEFPLVPFITYVALSTFTPGPNNLSSAGFSLLLGFRRTLAYRFGIAFGVVMVMLLSAATSGAAEAYLPDIYPVLKILGSLYILWLAASLVKGALTRETKADTSPGSQGSRNSQGSQGSPTFLKGVLLQLMNPKIIIYGLTVFLLFIHPHSDGILPIVLFSLLIAAVCLTSVTLWALAGTAVDRLAAGSRGRLVFTIISAALLVYTAIAMLFSQVQQF